MRQHIKRELLEMVKTFKELCDLILMECERQNVSYALELMQQCQNAAISMGENIEKLEGEGTEAVTVLEEFCEHLYQLGDGIGNGTFSYKKESKLLNKFMIRLENGIRHIETTYEVVFMPYKASMWDCMESIYKAAAADKRCKAFVVPIPYFDEDESGNGKKLNYEGNQLPDDIPVIPYQNYRLEERKPDVAYIHNPYDDYNRVTSVHPEYYSRNLKRYVSKLVYVPYYVTGGLTPESHRMLPIHQFMDYMVIQSKGEERFYKDALFQGKLLPLGSPKFDKIISYEEQGVEIPQELQSILEGKKVFFYNTSLSSLLADTENAFRKMQYVFRCFQEREDAVLIWRPHPLTEATIKSMRPAYYPHYQAMVKAFVESGCGVLDQTADISKTIALSDAYIGESSSSVVHLFGATGKPLFLFNMSILEKTTDVERLDADSVNIVSYKGKKWTFLKKINALCQVDEETGMCHIVGRIPGQALLRSWLVGDIYGYQNKIILSPANMNAIVEYEIDTGVFNQYPLPRYLPSGNMGSIIPYGEDFFILPIKYPAIIQYSAKEKSYIYHTKAIQEVYSYGSQYEGVRNYFGGITCKDNKLYFPLVRSNGVFIWDMETCEGNVVEVGEKEFTYGAIAEVEGGFVLTLYAGVTALIYWNPDTGETRALTPQIEGFQIYRNPRGEIRPYGGFYELRERLFLIPGQANIMLEIDKKTLEITKCPIDFKEHIREPQAGYFDNRYGQFRASFYENLEQYYKKDLLKEEIKVATAADGCLLHIDLNTYQYTESFLKLDKQEASEHISVDKAFERFSMDIPYACTESAYVGLEDFIDGLVQEKLSSNREEQLAAYHEVAANLDGTCGEKVHQAIMRSLE